MRIEEVRASEVGPALAPSDAVRGATGRGEATTPAADDHVPRARTPDVRIDVSIVVVTAGDAALGKLLRSLVEADLDHRVHLRQLVLVDDRGADAGSTDSTSRHSSSELDAVGAAWMSSMADAIDVVRGAGRGGADALRGALPSVTAEWAIVLDEQVTVNADWWHCLADDLCASHDRIGASLGGTVDGRSSMSDIAGRKRFASDRALRVTAVDDVTDPSPDGAHPSSLLRPGWALSLGSRTTSRSGGASQFELAQEASHAEPSPPSRRGRRVPVRLLRLGRSGRVAGADGPAIRRLGRGATGIGRSLRSVTGYRRAMTDHTPARATADPEDVQTVAEETSARVQPRDPLTEPPNSTVDDWFGQRVQADADRIDAATGGHDAPSPPPAPRSGEAEEGRDDESAAPSDSMRAADAANGESAALNDDA